MKVDGSIPVKHGMTVGELRAQLSEDGVPDHAVIDLYVDRGGHQLDSGTKEIKVSWDTSVKPVPSCSNHNLVLHRDRRPPWCDRCRRTADGTRIPGLTQDSRDAAASQDER